MQLMSQSKSRQPTYLSSTIPLSGATINCYLDVALQDGFCERMLADSAYRRLLCLPGVVTGLGNSWCGPWIFLFLDSLESFGCIPGIYTWNTCRGLFRCKISTWRLWPYFGRGPGAPCVGRGGAKKPPRLTLPFGVWQQWNLVGIQYRSRTFQNNQKISDVISTVRLWRHF